MFCKYLKSINCDKYWEKKIVSKLGFEPQISSFKYWRSTIEPLRLFNFEFNDEI